MKYEYSDNESLISAYKFCLTSIIHSFFPASNFMHVHTLVISALFLSGLIQLIGCNLSFVKLSLVLYLCILTTSKVKPPTLFFSLSITLAPNARHEHNFFFLFPLFLSAVRSLAGHVDDLECFHHLFLPGGWRSVQSKKTFPWIISAFTFKCLLPKFRECQNKAGSVLHFSYCR